MPYNTFESLPEDMKQKVLAAGNARYGQVSLDQILSNGALATQLMRAAGIDMPTPSARDEMNDGFDWLNKFVSPSAATTATEDKAPIAKGASNDKPVPLPPPRPKNLASTGDEEASAEEGTSSDPDSATEKTESVHAAPTKSNAGMAAGLKAQRADYASMPAPNAAVASEQSPVEAQQPPKTADSWNARSYSQQNRAVSDMLKKAEQMGIAVDKLSSSDRMRIMAVGPAMWLEEKNGRARK